VGKFLQTKPIHNFDYYWLKSFAAESDRKKSRRLLYPSGRQGSRYIMGESLRSGHKECLSDG
jgi:hypothetical protein